MSSDSDTDCFDWDPIGIIFSSDSGDSCEEEEPAPKRKRLPVRSYYLDRNFSGAYTVVFQKLANEDPELFYKYTRMCLSDFEELLLMVKPMIEKETVVVEPMPCSMRLAITLRYLATGESQRSLSFAFKCSPTSVHSIVSETTHAITLALKGKVFPKLSTDYFKSVAAGFESRWNFPNCIGAIDGKHIAIQAPFKSGSEFYNYKNTYSIVLMAICDHDYKFIACDIGAAGRQSDGGVFRHSKMGTQFYSNTLPIPTRCDVSENFKNVPYVILADDAFSLNENMLKPYKTMPSPKHKIFNYRLSRARRMIENCFGILSSKWRIFRSTINADVCLVESITQSCDCLHNWLRSKNSNYIVPGLIDHEVNGKLVLGVWRQEESNFHALPLTNATRNSSNAAKLVRDRFAEYFIGEGAVEWQQDKI